MSNKDDLKKVKVTDAFHLTLEEYKEAIPNISGVLGRQVLLVMPLPVNKTGLYLNRPVSEIRKEAGEKVRKLGLKVVYVGEHVKSEVIKEGLNVFCNIDESNLKDSDNIIINFDDLLPKKRYYSYYIVDVFDLYSICKNNITKETAEIEEKRLSKVAIRNLEANDPKLFKK